MTSEHRYPDNTSHFLRKLPILSSSAAPICSYRSPSASHDAALALTLVPHSASGSLNLFYWTSPCNMLPLYSAYRLIYLAYPLSLSGNGRTAWAYADIHWCRFVYELNLSFDTFTCLPYWASFPQIPLTKSTSKAYIAPAHNYILIDCFGVIIKCQSIDEANLYQSRAYC